MLDSDHDLTLTASVIHSVCNQHCCSLQHVSKLGEGRGSNARLWGGGGGSRLNYH